MSDQDMPPAVFAVLKQVWESKEKLYISLSPQNAWTTVAVIQYATRNPQLSPVQREAAIAIGRSLQNAIQQFLPAAADILEEGWNPDKDVPR